MKTYTELIKFQTDLFQKVHENPETAMDFFKTEWVGFTIVDKRKIGPIIIEYCKETINSEPSFDPQIDESNFQHRKLCAIEILDKIKDEIEGRPDFGNLKLTEKPNLVDIAVVFRLLYELEYIDNTIPEISAVVVRLFDLPDKTTIFSNMSDNSKMEKAAKKFKDAIGTTKLIAK